MAKKPKKTENAKSKDDDSKIFAFLAVFLSIIGFIIALVAKKDNKYVMFYAKQSLILFIAFVLFGIASAILGIIPVIGWLISGAIYLLLVIAWIMGWVYALSGEEKQIPVIGQYAEKIKL